jgi:single stranded DNA-binding protein
MSCTISLIGRLGADPEMIYTEKGLVIYKFFMYVPRVKQNEDKSYSDMAFNVVAFGELAEKLGGLKYSDGNLMFAKGVLVNVTGKLSFRTYTSKDGVEREAKEVTLLGMDKIAVGSGNKETSSSTSSTTTAKGKSSKKAVVADDIPF